MLEALQTTDGLIAAVILVLVPLLIILWTIWMERGSSKIDEKNPVASFLGQSLRTIILVILLTLLPPLIGAFASVLQLILRPDGGGWIVQPEMTFVIPPLAYLVGVFLLIRRARALQRLLKG